MIDLLNLEPQQISRNLKGKMGLIYGSPGCGKTTFASKFEKALICAFEMGTNALHNVYVQPIKTWSDWKQVVNQLVRKPELQEKYNNIIIDTCDEAYKLCERWLCSQYNVESIKDVAGYGAGYKMLDDNFMTTFRDLSYAGYGLLFISHETEKTYTNDKGEEYNKIIPALPNRPFNLINKMVDIIGYIREVPIQNNDEVIRKRFMYMRGDDRFLTKSRFKYIVPKIELDYDAYVNAIYNAIDKQVEVKGGVATENENPFLVRTYDELKEEAKELWGKLVGKDLVGQAMEILKDNFGKPIKFSEIPPEQTDIFEKSLFEIKSLL